ncbi:MAG: hypothetical protein Harvfovirus17_26, partial [Harvfovirus sp.]
MERIGPINPNVILIMKEPIIRLVSQMCLGANNFRMW